VLTGDSFFHLSALGEPLDGLNLCGAGRVVCLIDPVGDVYACPFVIDKEFLAGNVRDPGGFARVWRQSDLFASLREPQSAGACASCGSYDACQGGCMAAKFFTGLPLDGPDPECVFGHGEEALAAAPGGAPRGLGHSKVDRTGPHPGSHSRPLPVAAPAPDAATTSSTWSSAAPPGRRSRRPGGDCAGRAPRLARAARAPPAARHRHPDRRRAGRGRLAGARPDVVVAPAVPYGASGEHAAFPGTLLVGHEVLADLLVELVRSARAPSPAWCWSPPTGATARAGAGRGAVPGRRRRRARLAAVTRVATPTPGGPRRR
jgi:radical SAM protein with 4Fe4S-binding SPASM domain